VPALGAAAKAEHQVQGSRADEHAAAEVKHKVGALAPALGAAACG
jgi:hypothetical protein